jgi:Fe-Mn family superoxide dismutase
MAYEAKNYKRLLGLEGFSDNLLKNHFTLYQGYVTNTNNVLNLLKKSEVYEYGELKRRFGWEFNGMRLHELYFDNLSKENTSLDKDSELYKKIVDNFGSFEDWEKDFKFAGGMRGIGWVVLAYDSESDKLFNIWINEHDVGYLAGATPILVMDVFEHAFMIDYGLKKVDYIESFFKAIDWNVVSERI